MNSELSPLYNTLTFLSPLSEARATKLCGFMARHGQGLIADLGCGWAELLLRLLATGPSLRGLGLDLNSENFPHARERAEALGVSDRLELIAGDARASLPARLGGALCLGASQIWARPGQTTAYSEALSALRGLVAPGSPVVYGEAIWSRPPSEAAVAAFSGRANEFSSLSEVVEIARGAGFAVMELGEASLDEWDEFESGFCARLEAWLLAQDSSHPDFSTVEDRLLRQRRAYLEDYRGTLGMAYLCLLAK